MAFFVYMLANKRNGTLYVGMTDDLTKRVWQHRNNIIPGFAQRYGVKMLVWYEVHESRDSAFIRERQIKKWNRAWKLELIERMNRNWCDLWNKLRGRFERVEWLEST
jgi:putative endonuclease